MRAISLWAEGFRNLRDVTFCPGEGATVIYGDNAQGKTNLLEALWLFSGARSFRGAKDADFLQFGSERMALSLDFFSGGREQTASIVHADGTKAFFLNGIRQPSAAAFSGAFRAVVFSPDHLALVKEGPEKRRRMLDTSLCQTYPKYAKALDTYEKTLRQRNRLLKDLPQHAALLDTLEAWDASLLAYGAYLTRMRARYAARLGQSAAEIYSGISLQKEALSVRYLPSIGGCAEEAAVWTQEQAVAQFSAALRRSRPEDIRHGVTMVGPHRDDLDIRLNDVSARVFGSQGQQRSCILALKLAECRQMEESGGDAPVILLDDVMSELDELRRSYLLNQLGERQVMITCCDASLFSTLRQGRVFRIRAGTLLEEKG